MSISIFVITSTWLQSSSGRFVQRAEVLANFGDLAEADIQIILQEDSSKYEAAYSYLMELYSLNDLYLSMVAYNATHPLNYTQQDFDEVQATFSITMHRVSTIIQSTSVYDYSVHQLGATVANNYTSGSSKYFFIINHWFEWGDPYPQLHADLRSYVNETFTAAGNPLDIPELKFEKWTYHLYNNLSMLGFFTVSKSIGYINNYKDSLGLSLVNLSLEKLSEYHDGYSNLLEKTDDINYDFNNTLLTLALASVLLGFTLSFDNRAYRKLSLIIGLVILLLSIVYLVSTLATLAHLSNYEAALYVPNEFTGY